MIFFGWFASASPEGQLPSLRFGTLDSRAQISSDFQSSSLDKGESLASPITSPYNKR